MSVGYASADHDYVDGTVLWNGADVPPLMISIGGTLHTALKGTLRTANAVGERATANVAFVVDDVHQVRKGMRVVIRHLGVRLFTGLAEEPLYSSPAPHTTICQLTASDHDVLAERKVVASSFQGPIAVGDVVRQLRSEYLSPEGVSDGVIEDGPAVSEAVFAYVYLDQVLDALADEVGFWWRIDGLRRLHFRPRTSQLAPWQLDNIDEWADAATIAERNPNYRNRQYVRGGKGETDPQTEITTVGGTQRVVTTAFPVARVPTVKVNDVAQTVGIRGLEEGRDWYWNKGDKVLSVDESAPDLETGDVVEVTYRGLFDIVVLATSGGEVEERREIEGAGSGLVEHVESRPDITTTGKAFELAAGLLDHYGRIGFRLQFTTTKPGLEAGQLLIGSVPTWGIDSVEFLVESVEVEDLPTGLTYVVLGYSGPLEGSWTKWFKQLAHRDDPLLFRENVDEEEVLVLVETFDGTAGVTESTVFEVFSCEVTGFTDDLHVDGSVIYSDPAQPYRGTMAGLLFTADRDTSFIDATVGYAEVGHDYRGELADGQSEIYPC